MAEKKLNWVNDPTGEKRKAIRAATPKPQRLAHTGGGISLYYKNAYRPCSNIMAALFLGNDDQPRAYCLAGAKMVESPNGGNEYHLFDEISGRFSTEFMNELTEFLRKVKAERVILVCSDEELRYRVKRALGIRMIFEDERRRNNSSIIMRDWFGRCKPGTDTPLLKVWGDCREAIKSNYPPARDCMVRLLEYYDKRMRVKASAPRVLSQRAGYG